MRKSALKSSILTCAAIGWIVGLAFGLSYLARYQSSPGPTIAAGEAWPADAPTRATGIPTLVLFLHPECPCSQATIASLDEIMAHVQANPPRLGVYVFAVLPSGAPADWAHSPLIERAAAIPGVRIFRDDKGSLAREFGARTSGHTAVYDVQGKRIFAGGITPGRGHEGDNAGADVIKAIALGKTIELRETPVFGCALMDSTSVAEK